MACGRPLFPGSTVEDELHLIFKTLGTPDDIVYPGISQNEEYLLYNIPVYSAEPLLNIAPRYVVIDQFFPHVSFVFWCPDSLNCVEV